MAFGAHVGGLLGGLALVAGYQWLRRFREGELSTVEVTEEATSRFADDIAEAMVPTVWNTGCNSWYFADDSHIDLWPFDRKRLTRMLSRPRDDDYILTR